MKLLQIFALICTFTFPAIAQTSSTPAAPVGAVDAPQLHVARSGNEVMITWAMPPDLEIRQFEIFRNTHKDTKGRGRAASLRPEPAIYIDQVTDLDVTYWYWLKITLGSGQVVNIGPVATPQAAVWTP